MAYNDRHNTHAYTHAQCKQRHIHAQTTKSDLEYKVNTHNFPVLMKPKILISSEWPLSVSRGSGKTYCQVLTIWMSSHVSHNMYPHCCMRRGVLGSGGVCIQDPSYHIKITIKDESKSHVCAGQILTQQDRQSCQLVSLILNPYIWLVQPDAVLLHLLGIFWHVQCAHAGKCTYVCVCV